MEKVDYTIIPGVRVGSFVLADIYTDGYGPDPDSSEDQQWTRRDFPCVNPNASIYLDKKGNIVSIAVFNDFPGKVFGVVGLGDSLGRFFEAFGPLYECEADDLRFYACPGMVVEVNLDGVENFFSCWPSLIVNNIIIFKYRLEFINYWEALNLPN